MPFKIVQTTEKGGPKLSIVPSVWEDNGKLFWPPEKVKNRSRLIRDERSFASPNWDILDCVVKRKNISTYAEAVTECQIMENQTDTDNETPTPATATYIQPEGALPANHFENMMQNLAHNVFNESASTFSESNNPVVTNEVCLPVFDGDQYLANQTILIQKINNQEHILQNLVEGVQKVTQKVAELSVQFEECLVKVMEKIEQPVSVTLLKDADPDYNESFTFRQINNKEQLENLERSITDKVERSKLQNQFSFLFQPCEGNGLTFAYKLLDSLFSREFLCKCSWSGGSRGNLSKIPIKDFKNFLNFFCNMIRSWDSTFTMGQTEKFFKSILKNAVKRKSMKDLRSSSKRARKSKPTTKDQASTSQENPKPSTSTNKVFANATNNQNLPTDQIDDEDNQNQELDEILAMEVVKKVNTDEEGEKQDESVEDLC